jgi:NAD(P)H-hydrate epimerase
MRIVTADQMRRIEQAAFERGVDPFGLMGEAGRAAVRAILARLGDRATGAKALVLVGPRNNGGDGLVIAEGLAAAGLRVTLWLYRREGLGGAPVANDLIAHLPTIHSGEDTELVALQRMLAEATVVVDAIYGIGGRSALAPDLDAALAAANERGRMPGVLSVAVDIPTGVNATTGEVTDSAFIADLTVTFGRPKLGLYLPPGMGHSGAIVIETIGLDEGDLPDGTPRLITRDDALPLLPRRTKDAHKGDAGSLLIVGGSRNYLGAPVLSAHAALRAGAGLVTLAVPHSLVPICAPQVPEATYVPLPESEWGISGHEAATALSGALGRYTALQIGNGLGRHAPTDTALARFFGLGDATRATLDMPILFDADGVNWLSAVPGWWEHLRDLTLVLTPHHGEMARLLGVERRAVSAEPWHHAREAAQRWGQTVVLKGGHSVVATPDGDLWVSPVANPALASAGTGDTLAGIIAGFLAQGLAPADAAILGLWIGARAADLASAALGTLPMLASDLPLRVAEAIHELE